MWEGASTISGTVQIVQQIVQESAKSVTDHFQPCQSLTFPKPSVIPVLRKDKSKNRGAMSFNNQPSVTTDSFLVDHDYNKGEGEASAAAAAEANSPFFPDQSAYNREICSSESESEEGQEEAEEESQAVSAAAKLPKVPQLQRQPAIQFPKLAKSGLNPNFLVVAKPKSKVTPPIKKTAPIGNSIIDIVESRKRSLPQPKPKKEKKRRETAAEREENKKKAFFNLMEKLYDYSRFSSTMDALNLNVPF